MVHMVPGYDAIIGFLVVSRVILKQQQYPHTALPTPVVIHPQITAGITCLIFISLDTFLVSTLNFLLQNQNLNKDQERRHTLVTQQHAPHLLIQRTHISIITTERKTTGRNVILSTQTTSNVIISISTNNAFNGQLQLQNLFNHRVPGTVDSPMSVTFVLNMITLSFNPFYTGLLVTRP